MIPPQTNFKILETNKGNICGGVSFRIIISRWIGQFEFFKRNTTKHIFLIIFQNFLNSSFSNIPSKKNFFSDFLFRYSGLQGCSVREKATVSQRFFVIYKILEHYFLSGHFQNISVVQYLLRW